LRRDAGLQPFQLDEAAERRVAAEPTVELQPANLLGDPCQGRLGGRDVDSERPYDGEQRSPVLGDVLLKPLQELPARRPPVAVRGPPRELDADHGAGEVVVQIDVELPHREHAAFIPARPPREPRGFATSPPRACPLHAVQASAARPAEARQVSDERRDTDEPDVKPSEQRGGSTPSDAKTARTAP